MTKTLLSALFVVGLATSASAQGIQPVTTEGATDVTMGSINSADEATLYAVAGAAAIILLLATHAGSDGTN